MLRPYLFRRGRRCPPAELAPGMAPRARRAIEKWLRALPPQLAERLPPLKICLFHRRDFPGGHVALGVSFIPQRYLILNDGLPARPAELGRVLYHELGHFLWPRLGARRRAVFGKAVAEELQAGVGGELGNSAESAKAESAKQWLVEGAGAQRVEAGGRKREAGGSGRPCLLPPASCFPTWRGSDAAWRYYLCESFCDTSAWALLQLAGYRHRHPEWTLPARARSARLRAWLASVM
jgi:hypothetical protein